MSIVQMWQEKEDDGTWSWSWARVAATFTMGFSVWGFWHQTMVTGHIPDAATLAGLMGFGLGPYPWNKGFTAFAKKDAPL